MIEYYFLNDINIFKLINSIFDCSDDHFSFFFNGVSLIIKLFYCSYDKSIRYCIIYI